MKCEKDKGAKEVAMKMVPLKETTASQPINNDTDKQEVKKEPLVFTICGKAIDRNKLPKLIAWKGI